MRSAPNIYAWRQMSNKRPLWEVGILMGTSVMCRYVVASMSPRIGITGERKKKKTGTDCFCRSKPGSLWVRADSRGNLAETTFALRCVRDTGYSGPVVRSRIQTACPFASDNLNKGGMLCLWTGAMVVTLGPDPPLGQSTVVFTQMMDPYRERSTVNEIPRVK